MIGVRSETDPMTEAFRVVREGPVQITKTTIEAAWRRRAPRQRIVIGDAGCPGLALIVNVASMSWAFAYKPRGTDATTGKRFPSKSVTIGSPASHSPEDARAEANALKGVAKSGRDPAAEKRAAIAADAVKRAGTLARLLDEYAKDLPGRPKMRGTPGVVSAPHAAAEIAHARRAVAQMGAADKPARDIGAEDLKVLLRGTARQPGVAKARFGALARFFDWLQDEGHVALNPCTMIPKTRRPRAPAARKNRLPIESLALLWKAAETAEGVQPVHRDLIRFLIAMPCRRNEAARMGWEQVDLSEGVWTQPGKMTKNGEPHRLRLHPLALAILTERHKAAKQPRKGLVFPAPRSGKAVKTFSDVKAALDKAASLSGWVWHDFRRSFASAMPALGAAEPVADAVLNHRQSGTRGGVLGVYQQAERWPEQVAALEAWGAALADAIEAKPAPAGKVVALRRA
jgi:integrase